MNWNMEVTFNVYGGQLLTETESASVLVLLYKGNEVEDMTHLELGERIQKLRKSNNLTRDQLASKSGLYSKFLYEIEKGRKGLSVESLIKITTALSCSCDEILMEEKEEE